MPIRQRRPESSLPSPLVSLMTASALALVAGAMGGVAVSGIDTPAAEPRFWSDVLTVGDCILRPTDGTLPAPISCDELHEEEIYAIGRLDLGPDEPYPGEGIADTVGERLCDSATVAFGGETWDRLPFSTYLLYPLEHEWAAGDRGIMCSAGPPEGVAHKRGTAAGGLLDSDDLLLARGGFSSPETGDISEWVLVEEHATLSSVGTLSDGRFDLPLRRAWAVPEGFIFDAAAREGGYATTTWAYDWDRGEFTSLGSLLPGGQLASTMKVGATTVFAGRESPDDDWDLFAATPERGVYPLAEGPGQQQYPTFTPDGTQVVFSDDGKLIVVDVDGSNSRTLVDRESQVFESAVSPDGEWVVFASDHGGNDDIWLTDFDGGEPVNLSDHPADEAWPTWSADGSRIYFQTDRLRPETNVGSLMVMHADGSDASWFSGASLGQALVLDTAAVRDVLPTLLTIDERHLYEGIAGEPGTTARWEHSTGRLALELPVGWRVRELDEAVGLVAAPRPTLFDQVWESDGVVVTLHDGYTSDGFFALFDETPAAQHCERLDGPDGVQPLVADGLAANFACGAEGAVAEVVALYDSETGVGVLIEGQRDSLPTAEADREILEAIGQSLVWE